MDFRCLVRERVRKITFFGLKSGQDLENQAGAPSPKIPKSTPPPGGIVFQGYYLFHTLSLLPGLF